MEDENKMNNNYQRKNSISNTFVGKEFELTALNYFKKKGIDLMLHYSINVGLEYKKKHNFDLGNDKFLVECKSMKWTESDNVPSAKIRSWNEAMYYFHIAPKNYTKILFVQMDYSQVRTKTLLEYYIEKYYHLIPNDVLLYDYYLENGNCEIFDNERIKSYIK